MQHADRPTAQQLYDLEWMGGPKEKLVLQHSEFMISQRVQTALLWIEQLRSDLKILDVDVSEKYTADAGEEVRRFVS